MARTVLVVFVFASVAALSGCGDKEERIELPETCGSVAECATWNRELSIKNRQRYCTADGEYSVLTWNDDGMVPLRRFAPEGMPGVMAARDFAVGTASCCYATRFTIGFGSGPAWFYRPRQRNNPGCVTYVVYRNYESGELLGQYTCDFREVDFGQYLNDHRNILRQSVRWQEFMSTHCSIIAGAMMGSDVAVRAGIGAPCDIQSLPCEEGLNCAPFTLDTGEVAVGFGRCESK